MCFFPEVLSVFLGGAGEMCFLGFGEACFGLKTVCKVPQEASGND